MSIITAAMHKAVHNKGMATIVVRPALRADVIVDTIMSLQVVTKTHELYLEETPEKFQVRAYDEEGNEVSTLEVTRNCFDS